MRPLLIDVFTAEGPFHLASLFKKEESYAHEIIYFIRNDFARYMSFSGTPH
jgi:hypothetical protein